MRNYTRRTLSQGEKVIEEAQFQWEKYLTNTIWIPCVLFLFFAFLPIRELTIVGALVLVMILAVSTLTVISLISEEVTLTDQRLVVKESLLHNDTYDIPLSEIESVSESVGTLIIKQNNGQEIKVEYIKNASAFKDKVYAAVTEKHAHTPLICKECGNKITYGIKECPQCGCPTSVNERMIPTSPLQQNSNITETKVIGTKVIVINKGSGANGLAISGFVFAILGVLLGWVPIAGWIIWFLGFVLSFIGLFFSPRGLAIAGFIISFIDLFIIISIMGSVASLFNVLFE